MSSSQSGHIRGAAAEVNTIDVQQLKWMLLGAAAGADANGEQRINAIGEQQLKRTQLGSSS